MNQQIKTPEEFYHDYVALFVPTNTGYAELKSMTRKLNTIFEKSWSINSEETARLVAAWVLGTKENKGLENRIAYEAYIQQHLETISYIDNIKKNPNFSKTMLARLLVDDFKNSFELNVKILANLVCIDRLIHGQDYSLESFYFESASSLINRLKQSQTNWSFIINKLNKKVRNASSHLNFVYDSKKGLFIGKDLNRRTKSIESFEVTAEEFLLSMLPGQSNIIQSFIACGELLCMKNNSQVHTKALSILN
ncbi:MAG: hypothetical protein SPG62_06260 [Lactobacillus johnsonii]|nr:hypothetical protein [Mammaliicoccus lentus]MCI7713815.1 hypothetical protein [Lactobacillus johnsonii]MDY5351806.1 hypothetical protein [Lactobacillus johnsonii]HJF20510.1 hypothetical protein [Mammaliicoccus lentus]